MTVDSVAETTTPEGDVRIGFEPRVVFSVLILIALSALVVDRGEPRNNPPVQTDEEAIGLWAEGQGHSYAGQCQQTRSPEDIGKYCSILKGGRPGERAYWYGRTFSEPTHWVFIQDSEDGGKQPKSSDLDFFDMSEDIPWPP